MSLHLFDWLLIFAVWNVFLLDFNLQFRLGLLGWNLFELDFSSAKDFTICGDAFIDQVARHFIFYYLIAYARLIC